MLMVGECVGGWFQSGPTRFLHAVSNVRLLGVPKWGPRTRVADGHTPDPLSDEDERFQPRESRSTCLPKHRKSQVTSHGAACTHSSGCVPPTAIFSRCGDHVWGRTRGA